MKYIEYVQTDGYCYFDTGLYPSNNTEVRTTLTPLGAPSSQWNVFFGAQSSDDSVDTFQLRKNAFNNKWAPKVGDKSNQEAGNNFSTGTTYDIVLNGTALTANTNVYSIGNTSAFNCPYTMYIGCCHNPSWIPNGDSTGGNLPGRAQVAQYGRFQVYESGVLVGDFKPAVDNNRIGFFDNVSQTFRENLGTGTPVAGPDTSSIAVTASKSSLAYTGETISIDITCENAWTVTGNTFLTLSSTGDTGSTTITATAPSYTGATARIDVLTFTDTTTGDEMAVSIKQKKYSSGQPLYLGGDEITEIYLGEDSISEAYLGDVLVFSTGPFVGLRLSPKDMVFKNRSINTGDTFNLSVKSSEDWSLTTDADWFTLSPTTGLGTSEKTIITLTVTSKPSAETTNTITCTSANYSASTSTLFKMGYGIPANEIWYATSNGNRIASLNSWRVYDKSGNQMGNASVDLTTYGKMVFSNDIGYVAGDPYQVNNGWSNLTELGLPEMEPSMCTGTNDFGFRYIAQPLTAWTRVYGDYEYINDEETMAWGSDGCGSIISRGNSGTLTIPEGVKALGAYAINHSKWEHIILPTTFVGGVSSYNAGAAGGQHCFENMANLQTVKYQTLVAPPMYSNCWTFISQSGIVYCPAGGTGYGDYHRPINFTFQTYTP